MVYAPQLFLYLDYVSDIIEALEMATNMNFKGITAPLAHHNSREFINERIAKRHQVFSRSDTTLMSVEWENKVIGTVSQQIDCDSPVERIRKQSERLLQQELEFSRYLNSVTEHGPIVRLKNGDSVNLARCLTKTQSAAAAGWLLVEVPMSDPTGHIDSYMKKSSGKDKPQDTWTWWNNFRSAVDSSYLIRPCLELSSDLLATDELNRWLGEPVAFIIIPVYIFMQNRYNYPVLSRAHENFVIGMLKMGASIMLKGNLLESGLSLHADYLNNVITKSKQEVDHLLQEYEDMIEIPLQPLYDNLSCYTYEIFEMDPVKYLLYQQAIEQALIDKVPENEIASKQIIVMVVGAGRGPLVRSALNAAENTLRKIKIYIIEKNPNAIITLSNLITDQWIDKDIELISTDMRDFTPPEKVDILVSELLGSFGDNELSPECLDGAQKHLKSDGISIPCKSTSYINPIMSQRLYNRAQHPLKFGPANRWDTPHNHLEMIYVTLLSNVYHIADPKALFEFNHPNPDEIIDNSRYTKLEFNVAVDCVLHGFAGYFDTILYKDITLGIHPFTHTKSMLSWFPTYIPITKPQHLKANDILQVHFWREISSHKVWYEWCTSAPEKTHIHNQNGHNCAYMK